MKKLISAVALSLIPAISNADVWDMPMAYTASNFHSEHGEMFAEKVSKYSEKYAITVHPGGSLFGGADIKRAVQTGQAPIGERLMSAHANEKPILNWDNLPFLATTYDDSKKLWGAAKKIITTELKEDNLIVLYTCPWPGQGFYFNKEVTSSADIKGMKLRSYNAATSKIIESLGAIPVQIEAAELTQALATGVADGFISSGSTGYDRKVWEHLSHYYKVNAWFPRNYVVINKKVWSSVHDRNKSKIRQVAEETERACTKKSEELSDWYFEQLEANGMTVTDAGPEFLAELEAIGKEMQSSWLDSVGETGQSILDAYQNN